MEPPPLHHHPSREEAERENGPPEARANAPPEEFTLIIRGRRLYQIHLEIQSFVVVFLLKFSGGLLVQDKEEDNKEEMVVREREEE